MILESDIWDFDSLVTDPSEPNYYTDSQNNAGNATTVPDQNEDMETTSSYEYSDQSSENDIEDHPRTQHQNANFDEELGDLNDTSLNPASLPKVGQLIIFLGSAIRLQKSRSNYENVSRCLKKKSWMEKCLGEGGINTKEL